MRTAPGSICLPMSHSSASPHPPISASPEVVVDRRHHAYDLVDLARLADAFGLVAWQDLEDALIRLTDPGEVAVRVVRELFGRLTGTRRRVGDHRRLELVQ